MKNNISAIPAIFFLVLTSCTHTPMQAPQVKCSADTITTVSFSKDVLPLLVSNCAITECHSGSVPKGHLNLEAINAYEQLWQSGTGFIDTGSATNSLLYSQLVSVSDPMPPTGKLKNCSIALIKKWIEQKGLNN